MRRAFTWTQENGGSPMFCSHRWTFPFFYITSLQGLKTSLFRYPLEIKITQKFLPQNTLIERHCKRLWFAWLFRKCVLKHALPLSSFCDVTKGTHYVRSINLDIVQNELAQFHIIFPKKLPYIAKKLLHEVVFRVILTFKGLMTSNKSHMT